MSLLHFNLSGFGLDISDLSIKIAQVVSSGGGHHLSAWGKAELKPGLIDKGVIVDRGQVVSELIKLKENVKGKLTSNFAVACLPETKTFIKVFELPKKGKETKKKVDEVLVAAIEEELPKEIPLPVENITYDYQIVSEDDKVWRVLVGAAPRDIILEYNETIKAAGFNVLALEIEAQAIVRALIPGSKMHVSGSKASLGVLGKFHMSKLSLKKEKEVKEKEQADDPKSEAGDDDESAKKETEASPETQSLTESVIEKQHPKKKTQQLEQPLPARHSREKPVIIADLGAARSSIIIFHEGSIRLTRSVPLSGTKITQEIMEAMSLTEAKAEQAKIVCGLDEKKCKGKIKPAIQGWVAELVDEISTTMTYYHGTTPVANDGFEELYLCGGGAALTGLASRLSEELGIPVRNLGTLDAYHINMSKGVSPVPKRSLPGFATVLGLALRSM